MSIVFREFQKTVRGRALSCDGCGTETPPSEGNWHLDWPAGWIGVTTSADQYVTPRHFCGVACAIAHLTALAPVEIGAD